MLVRKPGDFNFSYYQFVCIYTLVHSLYHVLVSLGINLEEERQGKSILSLTYQKNLSLIFAYNWVFLFFSWTLGHSESYKFLSQLVLLNQAFLLMLASTFGPSWPTLVNKWIEQNWHNRLV